MTTLLMLAPTLIPLVAAAVYGILRLGRSTDEMITEMRGEVDAV